MSPANNVPAHSRAAATEVDRTRPDRAQQTPRVPLDSPTKVSNYPFHIRTPSPRQVHDPRGKRWRDRCTTEEARHVNRPGAPLCGSPANRAARSRIVGEKAGRQHRAPPRGGVVALLYRGPASWTSAPPRHKATVSPLGCIGHANPIGHPRWIGTAISLRRINDPYPPFIPVRSKRARSTVDSGITSFSFVDNSFPLTCQRYERSASRGPHTPPSTDRIALSYRPGNHWRRTRPLSSPHPRSVPTVGSRLRQILHSQVVPLTEIRVPTISSIDPSVVPALPSTSSNPLP